jgi:prepilin peptidase CpaA
MFSGSVARLVAGGVYTFLLLLACVFDLRTRRLPNALVTLLGVTGLAFSLVLWPVSDGLVRGFGGLALGFLVWIPWYALGMIGAGDVKFFAAAGAWLGPSNALVAAVVAALVGGVLAVAWMLAEQGIRGTARSLGAWIVSMVSSRSLHPVAVTHSRHRVPYGIALAAGAALVGWLPGLAR